MFSLSTNLIERLDKTQKKQRENTTKKKCKKTKKI